MPFSLPVGRHIALSRVGLVAMLAALLALPPRSVAEPDVGGYGSFACCRRP